MERLRRSEARRVSHSTSICLIRCRHWQLPSALSVLTHNPMVSPAIKTLKGQWLTCLDPNAPKRGLSAYMFFANEQRENVREENPGISFGQVGKLLGERWKALNEKQRAPYEAKAAADKKRYEDEKQAYNVRVVADLDEFVANYCAGRPGRGGVLLGRGTLRGTKR